MKSPTLVYDDSVMQTLLGLRGTDRSRILRALKELKENPHEVEPLYTIRDASERILSVTTAKPFLITYWLDSPVNELRIVDIQHVRF
jgi:hypothetical protein